MNWSNLSTGCGLNLSSLHPASEQAKVEIIKEQFNRMTSNHRFGVTSDIILQEIHVARWLINRWSKKHWGFYFGRQAHGCKYGSIFIFVSAQVSVSVFGKLLRRGGRSGGPFVRVITRVNQTLWILVEINSLNASLLSSSSSLLYFFKTRRTWLSDTMESFFFSSPIPFLNYHHEYECCY